MRKKLFLSIVSHQLDITISLMIMKTTASTCKNQKFVRKVREASVEAIETIRFSLNILTVNHWTSSISQWELSVLG